MKIIYVISTLTLGGAERQVIETANKMATNGHAVSLYVLDGPLTRLDEVNQDVVKVEAVSRNKRGNITTLINLAKFIRVVKPDLIHSFLFDADVFCRLASLVGKKWVLFSSERNQVDNLSFKHRLVHKLTAFVVDAVVANSYAGSKTASAMYPASVDQYVVWNGIDIKTVNGRVAASKENYKRLFFGRDDVKLAVKVASIKPQKNHPLALQIADSLIDKDPSWRVLFLGEKLNNEAGGYRKRIFDQYSQLQNKDKIIFGGNRTDVLEILAQADISFMTSHHEGFPNAVLESMASGVPVVTTNYSDVQKILENSGQVVDGNVDSFITAIAELIKNPKIVHNQKKWIEKNATTDKLASNLEKIYRTYVTI